MSLDGELYFILASTRFSPLAILECLKKMVYHTASVNCFLLKTVTFTCTLHQIMHTTYSNNSLDSP